MSDISKINIGGGEYSLKDSYIRENCVRTDLESKYYTFLGGTTFDFNAGYDVWRENYYWKPIVFSYEDSQNNKNDLCYLALRTDYGKQKVDMTVRNNIGDITLNADYLYSDITLSADHYVDVRAQQFTLKDGTDFRINPPSYSSDQTAFFHVSTWGYDVDGDDDNGKAVIGEVHTNNVTCVIEMAESWTNSLMRIGPYIEIYKESIRNSVSNNTFISGFDVISLDKANTRKEAKSKPSLQIESGALKLKYNSDNQIQIHPDLMKLISTDVQILQHTDDGDKTHNVCDTCRKTEALSSLSNYEYDESTQTLEIKIIN